MEIVLILFFLSPRPAGTPPKGNKSWIPLSCRWGVFFLSPRPAGTAQHEGSKMQIPLKIRGVANSDLMG